jgi:hypothetical protein
MRVQGAGKNVSIPHIAHITCPTSHIAHHASRTSIQNPVAYSLSDISSRIPPVAFGCRKAIFALPAP